LLAGIVDTTLPNMSVTNLKTVPLISDAEKGIHDEK
jgi:hypothetical protein